MARVVIEAKTPIAVGSGDKDIMTDRLVATDVNGLPYVPATSIAGVVRSLMGESEGSKDFFGYQAGRGGHGSEILFTEAKILNSKGEVVDGLKPDAIKDDLLQKYKELPIRQHVRIGHRGVTPNAGKFDEQVVFAGTRFCFEMEMVAEARETEGGKVNFALFEEVTQKLSSNIFRLGGGTRCGFGEIVVIDIRQATLDLRTAEGRNEYLEKSSNLTKATEGFWTKYPNKAKNPNEKSDDDAKKAEGWTEYVMELEAKDFFYFGSGFGDDDVDMKPVSESRVKWKCDEDGYKGEIEKDMILIPATSVKGALSHRVAFHYNKKQKIFADQLEPDKLEEYVGKNNMAVRTLFGSEGAHIINQYGDRPSQKEDMQIRGKVILSDVIRDKESEKSSKILNHVKIDRFTGGAIDGALFSEKATFGEKRKKDGEYPYEMKVLVEKKAFEDKDIKDALEAALKDICKGLLPLGGGVNRGHGVFTGKLYENRVEIYPEDKRNERNEDR